MSLYDVYVDNYYIGFSAANDKYNGD